MEKGNKRVIKGWIFYDWANSVYNLVISSAIFPVFYANVTESHYLKSVGRKQLRPEENVRVEFFGYTLSNSVLFWYVLAVSFCLVGFCFLVFSGFAEVSGIKNRFISFFGY